MDYFKILRKKLGHQQLILPSVSCAIFSEEKILLVKDKVQEVWYLPSGLQNLDESITQTAQREMKEELSIDIEVKDLVAVYSSSDWIKEFPNGDILQSLLFLFTVKGNVDPEDIQIQREELLDFEFFGLNSLPLKMTKACRQQCIDVQNFDGKTILR